MTTQVMTTQVLMPKLGESVFEGTVSRWLKQPGDRVEKLEPLLEISTDKIDTEIPSPAAGVLQEIYIPEGRTVAIGTVLAAIATTSTAGFTGRHGSDGHPAAPPTMLQMPPTPATLSAAPVPTAPAPAASVPHVQPRPDERPTGRAFLSPVVKRMAAEHRVDLDLVTGSGMAGRVTKRDILSHLQERQRPDTLPIPARPTQNEEAVHEANPDELLHPLTTMRRAIAQHMVQSKQSAPHVTTIFEVDMTAVVLHRERNRQAAAERGVPLTFTPYFVAAVAQALRAHPAVNSRFTERGIVEHRHVHIGVAVAVPGGLVVPVVHNADELTLAGLARAVADLAQRARSGTLSPDDLAGGTFTVTNHGVGGSLAGTPIIAQPQAAILGVGAIVKRPVVVSLGGKGGGRASLLPGPDDAIVIRPMAYLSLSFDHRLLDGAAADGFLAHVKQVLEGWPE